MFFDRMLDWMRQVKHAIGENIKYKKHIQIVCILVFKRGRCIGGVSWDPFGDRMRDRSQLTPGKTYTGMSYLQDF